MANDAAFETRASRAEALSREARSAREALAFAAKLFRAQGRIASAVAARHADAPLTGRLEDDLGRVTDLLPRFLDLAQQGAPEILAEEVRARRGDDDATARARLLVYWQGGREASEDYVSRAFLRPYVEALARVHVPPERLHREGHCPFCAGPPIVSFRRSEPDSHGANRHLACALCGGTWVFPRVRCVSCGEDDPPKLPAFQSPVHAAVRIEACETCKRYVKSIDLTLDARPIPEVDDLVSIAMDLWAIEQGFTRVEPGWAGI
jgi:formate dehydrogenase maturation protein FdhE